MLHIFIFNYSCSKYNAYLLLFIIIEACKECEFNELLCGIFRRTGNLNALQNMTLVQFVVSMLYSLRYSSISIFSIKQDKQNLATALTPYPVSKETYVEPIETKSSLMEYREAMILQMALWKDHSPIE